MAPDAISHEWHPARLIPTVGIRGQEEQEKRATSSLLAVMRAVPEFGHALPEGSRRSEGPHRHLCRDPPEGCGWQGLHP